MPLFGKKPFERLKPPTDMKPDEELFYCRMTHEIFRDYDRFFDRVILCNSLVWTCSLTGRPGLTYTEALESEKNARLTLEKFPEPLKKPLLFLATLTSRGRLNDMCDDVYAFMRGRYFVEEEVEVSLNGIKKSCEVVHVISNEREQKSPAGKQESKPKRVKNISPDKLKYEVRGKDNGKVVVVKSQCLSRPKGSFTKANNKLFIKHHTSSENGVWKVKENAVIKYGLADFEFNDVFKGPLPKYASSPTKKKVASSPEKAEKIPKPKEEKKEKRKNVAESTASKKGVQGKLNFKNQSEEEKKKVLEKEQEEFEKQRLLLEEERQRRRDELKKRVEEDRERLRQQRLKEREKKREEKRKLAEYMSSWKKPRDDLECDDLKDLPKPMPVDCNIPVNCFGDAVMILEFLSTFGELIKIKDSFPQGFMFEHLEKALLETDIQGCLNDLIQLLLTSIFQYSDVEEEKSNGNSEIEKTDVKEVMTNMTADEAEALANVAFTWPWSYHGTKLQNMPLDSFSVTEILRLHILASGSNKNHTFAQGFDGFSEDPGFFFKMEESQLVQKLANTSVFQTTCEERVKILSLLIHQLVMSESFRSTMEENLLKARPLKMELKQLKWAYSRQLKEEEALSKLKKKQDDKDKSVNGETNGEETSMKVEEEENVEALTPEEREELEEKKKKEEARRKSEFLRKERDLKAQIQQLQSSFQVAPLGRDRAFRRFWVFQSLPGIFVEDDDKFIGPCLLKETPPQLSHNATVNRADGAVGSIRKYFQHLGDMKNGSSDKENDILQDLAIIQSDISSPLKDRKLSDLNTRVDTKKSVIDNTTLGRYNCAQCKEKAELQGSMPWYCPHSKAGSAFGMCTACIDTCSVHNLHAPRTKWSFYSKPEELDSLLNSLNPRGFRESILKEALFTEKDNLAEHLSKCQCNLLNRSLPTLPQPEIRKSQRHQGAHKSEFAGVLPQEALELTLRDMILELEQRMHAGGLGSMKVLNREAWRGAMEHRSYDRQCDQDVWDSKCPAMVKLEGMDPVVKDMACALLQVSNGIEIKYLHPPLGENEAFKQLKEKSLKNIASWEARQKSKDSENERDSSPCPEIPKPPLARWQESLMKCSSLSQLFVHLGTLERSVAWSRSVLKAHCRICRRRGDGENMLLCDGCNRGHHLYCLKPPLTEIPHGDWFCVSCKPPEKTLSPQKKRQNLESASEEESDDNEGEEDSDYAEDNEEEEEEMDEDIEDIGTELCESCGGTGTVICCDKCPKVYHPECVSLRRIPRGEWMCPKCTKKEETIKKSQRHGLSGSYGTRAQTLVSNSSARKRTKTPPPTLRTKIQIRATKRRREGSTDSESAPPKRARTDSSSRTRRRSKSSGDGDLLDYKTCVDLLVELMHHSSGWPFLAPVSKKDAPNYHLIIKRPMDFGTIRSKLNNMSYKNNNDFVHDLYLVLQNCELFNPRDSPEYRAARVLHKEVDRLLKDYQLTSRAASNLRQDRN